MKKIWILMIITIGLLLLSGCGNSTEPIAKEKVEVKGLSDKEKIKKLEEDGIIPKLNRDNTLAGPDTNGNGVRDDIDKYIDNQYTKPKEHSAAIQVAQALQKMMLVDKTNKHELKEVSLQSVRAINCAINLDMFKTTRELESLITNTKKRLLEYLKYSRARNGSTSHLPEGDTCE